VRRQIEMQISRGVWEIGRRIPGERELARSFGVNQMTANRTIQELVREGLLERRVGSGTFVCAPSQAAQAEPSKLVLVVPYTDHPEDDVYLRRPFRSICHASTQHGVHLQVVQAGADQYPAIVDSYSGSTFIFAAPHELARETLEALHSHGVPLVSMGASWLGAQMHCVDSDNRSGAKRAVEYLLRLGHTRIGFVNGDGTTTNCRDRLEGYREALESNDTQVRDHWIAQAGGDWEIDSDGQSAVVDMLLHPEPVTAIVAAGFFLSLQLLKQVGSLQLKVPEDVSVISLDDSSAAEHLAQPLTAMRQPLAELGVRAAAKALSLLRDASVPALVDLLPMELIVRSSCERCGSYGTAQAPASR
jgi:DNA-binding LacI/PurR family transcriptional regulator